MARRLLQTERAVPIDQGSGVLGKMNGSVEEAKSALALAIEVGRPTGIVAALLGIVVMSIDVAVEAALENRVEDRFNAVNEALGLICDLHSGVDTKIDDDWSRRTHAIYEESLRMMTLANVRNDWALLRRARHLLEPLRLAWTVLDSCDAPSAAPGVEGGRGAIVMAAD